MEPNVLFMQLKDDFLGLLTEKEDLVTNRRDSIFVKFINLIGKDEYEVFHLEIELKAIKFKIKLAQAYINKGQNPDFRIIENRICDLWREHESRLKKMAEGVRIASDAIGISKSDIDDLKDLYKMLVKRLHPDLNPELPEELRDLLTVVKAAYKAHDINALRQLAIKYQLLFDSGNGDATPIDYDSMIPMLKAQIEQLNKYIKELKNSFPLNLTEKLNDKEWVLEKQLEFKERREKIEEEIKKQNSIYSLIVDCYGK